ncbi:hypothetical protein J5N97_021601 [Dioscorea zingiberensis]|uniref:Filament-like plant protein 4 n=1 Tax=Dioscorea zingiberensis TaxID=325984 RepID=A0A9D5C956_9LILI|nr:hypothetical protein J5N97_021601 [Dioscorea zingiberensis]
MDKRSWPWKKKSSEKAVTTDYAAAAAALSGSGGNQVDQENAPSVKNVQISAESYARLTGLEDEVKVLNEKLTSAQSEITTKEELVKQHAKVAEEAVSGWEKAEAEALTLKEQLESVTLLKLTAEEQASHLDSALKECMKQIRNVKEESEQKLQDVVLAKTKQWEKMRSELEAKIVDFEEELLRASAENAALSRSFQERTNVLMQISDEKTQADAEIEVLKNNLQSCEREIHSLKYELHIVSKELEIRNEEKNMSIRSAEVANKQHTEDVKKITKLEAECQRLRGLVRKKLPGPAALAQMKLEVENLGRVYGEPRVRRSSPRGSSPHFVPAPDFAFENLQQFQKENEFLTERLLSMEEETKMLKEALSKRNGELQASRNLCSKTANRLRSIEAHILVLNQQKDPSKPNIDIALEASLSESNPPSITSMSEDGIDEEGSCLECGNTTLSEFSQLDKEKYVYKAKKIENPSHLDLMDDFLEMERFACLSTETDGDVILPNNEIGKTIGENADATQIVQSDGGKGQAPKLMFSCEEKLDEEVASNRNSVQLSNLQSRIASLFQSQPMEPNLDKVLEDIKHIVQHVHEDLPLNSSSCIIEENHSVNTTIDQQHYPENIGETADSGTSLEQISTSFIDTKHAIDQKLKTAISQIHDFVISLGRESMEIQGRSSHGHELHEEFQKFSASVNRVLSQDISLDELIISLSHILSDMCGLSFSMFKTKHNEGENSSDYIDKVTLLENTVTQHEPTKERSFGASLDSHHPSELKVEGPMGPAYELMTAIEKCSSEELEQLKLEKKNMEVDLAKCTELLEQTKVQLVKTEQHLSELVLELAACQKSNSLAETQLKCMTESYKLLESRTQELVTEIDLLHVKAEALEKDLQEEKRSHEDDLAKYEDLKEKMERNEKCTSCSLPSDADAGTKAQQEREIAAAAEKLAECQETIFLLSKQLKAMRPPAELMDSSPVDKQRMSDASLEDQISPSGFHQPNMPRSQQSEQAHIEQFSAFNTKKTGGESPSDGFNMYMNPSDGESSSFPISPIGSRIEKQRSSGSSEFSISRTTLSEKQGRGFSRFFSKGKSGP